MRVELSLVVTGDRLNCAFALYCRCRMCSLMRQPFLPFLALALSFISVFLLSAICVKAS